MKLFHKKPALPVHIHSWKKASERCGPTLLAWYICDCGEKKFRYFFPLLSTEPVHGHTYESWQFYYSLCCDMARDIHHDIVAKGAIDLGES